MTRIRFERPLPNNLVGALLGGVIMGLVATVVLVTINTITLARISSEALLPLPTSIVFVVACYLVRQRRKRHLVEGN